MDQIGREVGRTRRRRGEENCNLDILYEKRTSNNKEVTANFENTKRILKIHLRNLTILKRKKQKFSVPLYY